MGLIQRFYRFILYRLLGWQLEGEIPRHERRLLFVFLPHTSNWDFVIGWLFVCAEKLSITIFGKDQFYVFPLTLAYRYFGVIPIKRNQSQNFVQQAAAKYNDNAPLWTAMAPEGTRSYRETLRSGYYYFAKVAEIQIVVVGPDFENKKMIVMPPRHVLPSFEEDAADLIKFAQRCSGKRPEKSI
ncbi:MAG: 1-acyl-sn-glycerol-3-phosphate acyltransferase [Pseudomonadota bacterium]